MSCSSTLRSVLTFLFTFFVAEAASAQVLQQVGTDITGTPTDGAGYVAMSGDGTTVAVGADAHSDYRGQVRIHRWDGSAWQQLGAPISGTEEDTETGKAVALNRYGNVVAIGAAAEGSDDDDPNHGHVKVFDWDGTSWNERVTLVGENAGDEYGASVSLSTSGNFLAVGAPDQDEDYDDYEYDQRGAVMVYEWDGTVYNQVGADIDGESTSDYTGTSVSISGDGMRVAFGEPGGSGGVYDSGKSRVFEWDGSTWNQLGGDFYGEEYENTGEAVALSSDGMRLAIGAPDYRGDEQEEGAIRVYEWDGSSWSQVGGALKGKLFREYYGYSVAISQHGDVVVGGGWESDANGDTAGVMRAFGYDNGSWSQLGSDIYGDAADDRFGVSVSISEDGQRIAGGSRNNDANGNFAGQVRVYDLVNQPPVFVDSGPFNIDENSAEDTVVGDINANDGDGGVADEDIHYSIDYASNNPNPDNQPTFDIDPDTGELTVNDVGDLDFETYTSLSIDVTADDGESENNETTTTVTVDINNVNEDPSFSPVNVFQNFVEDTRETLDFGQTAVFTDPDAGTSDVTLTIDANAGTFHGSNENGVAIGGSGTDHVALTGAPSDLDAYLDGHLDFTPPYNGNGDALVLLTMSANDHGHTGIGGGGDVTLPSMELNVAAVNDAPDFGVNSDVPFKTLKAGETEWEEKGWAAGISPGPPDESGQSVTFDVTNSNPTLFVEQPAVSETTGDLTFETHANMSGLAQVTVRLVDDGGTINGGQNTSTPVFFQVTKQAGQQQQNAAPEAEPDDVTLDEDHSVDIDVLANDTDPDGDNLTVAIESQPSHGTVLLQNDGTIQYSPFPDYNGDDRFDYSASDPDNASDTEAVRLTINPVNDRPVVADDKADTDEDTPVIIDVLANDSDVEDVLSVDSVDDPPHADVQITGTNKISYNPEFGFFGSETFDYVVSDGTTTATGSITVTVHSTNGPPIAEDDEFDVFDGDQDTFDLLDNDSDPDSDPLTVTAVGSVSLGTLTDNGDGTVTYSSPPGTDGTATFTYTIEDTEGQSATASVTIHVTGPSSDGDQVSDAIEDNAPNNGDGNNDGVPDSDQDNVTSLPIEVGGHAGEYLTISTPTGQPLSDVESIENPSPGDFPQGAQAPIGFLSYGFSNLSPGGSSVVTIDIPQGTTVTSYWKYGPTPTNSIDHWYIFAFDGQTGAVVGPDQIELHFIDGMRGDDDLTANGSIEDPGTPVFLATNQEPEAMSDEVSVSEDAMVEFDPMANDTDPDGDELVLILDSEPAHGTLTETENGYTYEPDPDFYGSDSFDYSVVDENGATASTTVTIDVVPVQDAPVTMDDSATTRAGENVVIDLFGNDSDVDGDHFWLVSQEIPPHGESVFNGDGTVTYTPDAGFNGTDSWRYAITDGSDASDTIVYGTVRVTVTAATASETDPSIPDHLVLEQNYPNPFNPSTRIRFGLPESGSVRIGLFDATGRHVRDLYSGNMSAGTHSIRVDLHDLPSGTYLYRLTAGGNSTAKTLQLVK